MYRASGENLQRNEKYIERADDNIKANIIGR